MMHMFYKTCCDCHHDADTAVENCERGVEYKGELPVVTLGHIKVLAEDESEFMPEELRESVTPETSLAKEGLAVSTSKVNQSDRIYSISTCSDIDSLGSPASLNPPSMAAVSESELLVWSVAVQITPGEPLGLILDTLDSKALLVCEVLDGPFQRHNETLGHDSNRRVQRDDSLVAVGGTMGDSEALILSLKAMTKQQHVPSTAKQADIHSISLEMTFARPRSIWIEIPKAYAPVGLELAHTCGAGGLLVKSIGSGMVKNWNMAHSSKGMRRMDRIVEVNGESRSTDKLLREIKVAASTGRKLEMQVMRYPGWEQLVAKISKDVHAKMEE
eukprot:TRINITY_DN16688_c0_g1_i1.p1 TRINITY_DN16688_c0_g1~~TRINITY_DN16688_c0_g1_i1.p1  ORF type:complete len:330 (-),score=50.25 TRINITY_DN16688_c0_g1_i1:516-1505(-)